LKHLLLSAIFILCVAEVFPHNKVLFEIGRQDDSASEFALYPDQYDSFLANFSGEKSYYVGYSSPDQQWPYAFPGPVDSWGWVSSPAFSFHLVSGGKNNPAGRLQTVLVFCGRQS
jgi:hypothetical protein